MLTANTLGVSYQATQGGLLEISEQTDGSGAAVLSAVNKREFDREAGHVHGGEETTVAAGDGRLLNTGAATVETTSGQTAEGDHDEVWAASALPNSANQSIFKEAA